MGDESPARDDQGESSGVQLQATAIVAVSVFRKRSAGRYSWKIQAWRVGHRAVLAGASLQPWGQTPPARARKIASTSS